MPLETGSQLGAYEILGPLGAGGMAEVYKARDPRLNRTVAIKVLPAHIAGRADLRERFEREARAIAAFNHPHICLVHDVGRHAPEGGPATDFLVMEYLEGETLADRIANGPLPFDQLLVYAVQIAGALDRAHRHGITHRDLKPGNIMADDVMLFAPGASGLLSVKATGGDPVPVTLFDQARGDSSHRHPRFLPDGDHFLYFVTGNRPESSGIYLGSLGSTGRVPSSWFSTGRRGS